jgi:hypothetical protein
MNDPWKVSKYRNMPLAEGCTLAMEIGRDMLQIVSYLYYYRTS